MLKWKHDRALPGVASDLLRALAPAQAPLRLVSLLCLAGHPQHMTAEGRTARPVERYCSPAFGRAGGGTTLPRSVCYVDADGTIAVV